MKSFLKTFFAILLSFVVIFAIFAGVAVSKIGQGNVKIKNHSYLVVDIYGKILEYNPPGGILSEIMGGEPETLQRILDNMAKAAVDKRIDGVIMRLSSSNSAGLAKLEEMRDAVKKVQAAGKKVFCFTDSMDRKTYYLAAACDSIFAPPPANFSFVGFGVGVPHVKGTLDKLGIKPNVHKIKEYKSAAEVVMRKDMSKYARENEEWMLGEYWDIFARALKNDRGIDEAKITELMKHALFTSGEAQSAGLVDRVCYWDQLEDVLKQKDDKRLRTVTSAQYASVAPAKLGLKGKKKIAVIHAQGTIGGRENKIDPLFGVMMGHESVCAQIRKARLDKNVAAIVFRVDSPGGEGLASDLISREIEITTRVKPVVVSMVDVAASGGYYISYKADKLVADPLTITGSIGSIALKFNMHDFYKKLGVTFGFVTKGPNALMMSSDKDFTKEEWQRFTENHWAGFNMWLEDVAAKRKMSVEKVTSLAYGRVWSGRQAKENGLVDELGGLDRAIDVAKELAGIPAGRKVTIVNYPRKKGFLQMVLSKSGGITAAVNWVLYRYIHQDIWQSWHSLSERSDYLMAPMKLD